METKTTSYNPPIHLDILERHMELDKDLHTNNDYSSNTNDAGVIHYSEQGLYLDT